MSGDDPKDVVPKDKGHLTQETKEAIRHQVLHGVGYKRPPTHSQFKPGRSGNPKGRPRGAPPDLTLAEQPTLEAVLEMAAKPVKIREGDRVFEVPMRDAITQSIFTTALKGNARSQGLAMDLMRTVEQKKAREVQERNAFWSRYKEEKLAELAEAAAKGEPPPHLLPHPDDIVIDPVKGMKLLGPIDEEDEARMNETIAYCETLFMQDVLDRRTSHRLHGTPLTEPGSAMLMFHALQASLPPRLQLTDPEIILRLMKFEAWPKRRLLKALHQAWHDLGKPMPRGTVLPNIGVTAGKLSLWSELIAAFNSGKIDLQAMAAGRFDDAALDLLDKHGVKVG